MKKCTMGEDTDFGTGGSMLPCLYCGIDMGIKVRARMGDGDGVETDAWNNICLAQLVRMDGEAV